MGAIAGVIAAVVSAVAGMAGSFMGDSGGGESIQAPQQIAAAEPDAVNIIDTEDTTAKVKGAESEDEKKKLAAAQGKTSLVSPLQTVGGATGVSTASTAGASAPKQTGVGGTA